MTKRRATATKLSKNPSKRPSRIGVAAEAQSHPLAAVLSNSNDGITVRDFDGRIIAWNRGAERMYGYSEAQALKMNIRDIVPDEKKEEELELLQRIRRGEGIDSFETQRKAQDGHLVDVWLTVTTLNDEAGNPIAIATTECDVTKRKQAEKEIRELNAALERRAAERTAELQESEERIRAILNTAADAIITIDGQGSITTFNAAAEKIFGYTAKEAIGQNVKILMPAPYRNEHNEYLRHYAESGRARIIGTTRELTARRKDGTTFPIELSVSGADQLRLFIGIIRDISERKAMEEEILTIAALEQQRIGQELHDEIQQELTGLGLLAQNLTDTLKGKSATEGELAAKLAAGISETNQRVRSLARGLVPVPVDAEGLASALRALAASTAEMSELTCNFDYPEPVEVNDDLVATHLYRTAQEAVTNALRHAQASEISIALRRADGGIRLEVRDNGIGIDEKRDLNQGLGLRIMRYRCNLVGGTLSVRPAEGGGTTVVCTLAA